MSNQPEQLRSADDKEIGRLIARYKCGDIDAIIVAASVQDLLNKIRHNARHAALTEAAGVADKHYEDQNFNAMYRQAGYQISAALLALRDKKGGK